MKILSLGELIVPKDFSVFDDDIQGIMYDESPVLLIEGTMYHIDDIDQPSMESFEFVKKGLVLHELRDHA